MKCKKCGREKVLEGFINKKGLQTVKYICLYCRQKNREKMQLARVQKEGQGTLII